MVKTDDPSKVTRKCLVALLPQEVLQSVIDDEKKKFTGKRLHDLYRNEFNAIKGKFLLFKT